MLFFTCKNQFLNRIMVIFWNFMVLIVIPIQFSHWIENEITWNHAPSVTSPQSPAPSCSRFQAGNAGIQWNRNCIYDRKIYNSAVDYSVVCAKFGSWYMSENEIVIIYNSIESLPRHGISLSCSHLTSNSAASEPSFSVSFSMAAAVVESLRRDWETDRAALRASQLRIHS